MLNLNGIRRWVCVLALFSSSAALAQADPAMKIIIDNQEIPGEHIDNIVISVGSGNINITTKDAYNYVVTLETDTPDRAQILSFGLDSNVLENEDVNISWETNNAVTCETSGDVAGWSSFVISAEQNNLTQGSTMITAPTPGQYGFTLTCVGSDEFEVVQQRDLTVSSATALVIIDFSAEPNAISVNDTTTVSWDVSNMDTCNPTGGTSEWQSTSINSDTGSVDITMPVAGNYGFGLDCTGIDGDTDSASSSVVVSDVTTVCSEPNLDGSIVTWENLFDREFPLPTGAKEPLNLGLNGYKAIEFTTTNADDRGLFAAIPNVNANGAKLGAISECPGDFDVPDTCWEVWGTGYLIWNTGADPQNDCALKKDTTYYFNLTFTNGVDPDSSTCDSSRCITTVQTINPTE